MTVLLDFDEYVLVLILLNLGVGDLLSARKVCIYCFSKSDRTHCLTDLWRSLSCVSIEVPMAPCPKNISGG